MVLRIKNMFYFTHNKCHYVNLSCSVWQFNRTYIKPSNVMSKIFQPINIVPKDAHVKPDEIVSKSQKLMLDLGYIRQGSPGTFCFLSLAQRSLEKLIKIVDKEMKSLGAQKILLPSLTSGDLWKTSGRWKTAGDELFRIKDRHDQDLILSPTHEEAITSMVASIGQPSYRQLPLLLYQISSKFRDEAKPRSGLLRAREFLMKDLYTFDTSLETAQISYSLIRDAYHRIFSSFGIKYITVQGDATSMGGSASEEFHLPALVGEDQLSVCRRCGKGANSELLVSSQKCPSCESTDLSQVNGIEVGHCFILGTRYSVPLKANFLNTGGKPSPIYMGCHGLGISRILAAVTECLSTDEELHWPISLAPYTICIITPKEGSKEELATEQAVKLYHALDSISSLRDDVILDDRASQTIGRRLRDDIKTGFPYIIVAGKLAVGENPIFELHDTSSGIKIELTFEALIDFFKPDVYDIANSRNKCINP